MGDSGGIIGRAGIKRSNGDAIYYVCSSVVSVIVVPAVPGTSGNRAGNPRSVPGSVNLTEILLRFRG